MLSLFLFKAVTMKPSILIPFVLIVSSALMSCSSDGPALGAFPDLSKVEGDPPFTLTAPTSKGPGAFSYTSSNAAVATIAGNTVTITGPGATTITAIQAAVGSYNESSTSAVLTVARRGCTAPATSVDNICTPPATNASYVSNAGLTWAPVTFSATYANAASYCTSTTINAANGWRLPTDAELTALRSSGAMNNQGWSLSRTWSSTAGGLAGERKTVRLDDGVVANVAETGDAYVACVK